MPRVAVAFLILAPVIIGSNAAFAPPASFPEGGVTVFVDRGASVSDISEELTGARVIKYPELFKILVRLSGQDTEIQAGSYLFKTPEDLFTVTRRLLGGAHGIPPVRITFPEGESVREMVERISASLPDSSSSEFLSVARPHEGYLFPDTYFFEQWADVGSIIRTMRENFDVKIAPYLGRIKDSGHSISDLIILASLVEKEARSTEARRIVAGILLNRLERGMPLQTDAVFGYIFERDTYPPTFDDLKVDSPYNTYLHTGLPPGPINNPGLDSIEAVLNPTKTDYLYYLTGTDNQMHYAKTYAGHQANQRKYLR